MKNFLQNLGLRGSLLFFNHYSLIKMIFLIIGFTCMITSLVMKENLKQIEAISILQIELIEHISFLVLIIGVCSILILLV